MGLEQYESVGPAFSYYDLLKNSFVQFEKITESFHVELKFNIF